MINLHKIKVYTKPFWLPVIAAVYLFRAAEPGPLVLAALSFGYIGDLLLLKRGRKWFITGACSFLAGHLFYIAVFLLDAGGIRVFTGHPLASGLLLLPYAAAGVILKSLLWNKNGERFAAAPLYLSVLFIMSYLSVLRYWSVSFESFLAVTAGTVLFVASDSMIAVRKLRSGFRFAGELVVLTYISAQLLIVIGLS